jgi:hypothetical protein
LILLKEFKIRLIMFSAEVEISVSEAVSGPRVS